MSNEHEGQTGAPTVPAGEREAFEAVVSKFYLYGSMRYEQGLLIGRGIDADGVTDEMVAQWNIACAALAAWAAARAVVAADTGKDGG